MGVGVLQSTVTISGSKEVTKKFTVKNADGKFQLRLRKADDGKYVVGYGLLLDK